MSTIPVWHTGPMTTASRHVAVSIDRSAEDVYDYVVDPANLAEWASGVGSAVAVGFVERNPWGVLDHDVTLPSGEILRVPMRVVPDGAGCEVVLTVRPGPGPGPDDDALDRDAAAVAADLATLKRLLDAR